MIGKQVNLAMQVAGTVCRKWWVLAVMLIGVAGAAWAGAWLGQVARTHENHWIDQPGVAVSAVTAEPLEFGEVTEVENFRLMLTLANNGNRPVRVEDLGGECPCTRIAETAVELAPGERTRVPVLVDLREIGWCDDADVRKVGIGVKAVIVKDDRRAPVEWVIKGKVRRVVRCSPLCITLGNELPVGAASRTFRCQIQPHVSLKSLSVKKAPAGWAVSVVKRSSQAQRYVLEMVAQSDKVGEFVEHVELEALGTDGKRVPTPQIRVNGRIVPSVDLIPGSFHWGMQRLGTVVRGTVLVVSRTRERITGINVTPQHPSMRVLSTRQVDGGWKVEVAMTIPKAGLGECKGTIQATLTSGQRVDQEFSGKWYGVGDE
jgi:hypothetical protein